MFQSGQWPSHWKLEQVIPIGKVQIPETEDDLRPIFPAKLLSILLQNDCWTMLGTN